MNFTALLVTAFLAEAIWETFKMVWQNGKISVDRIGSMAVGLLIAVGAGVDLFAMVGAPLQIPYVGMVLTGFLISRGSNFVHDLLAQVQTPVK